MSYKNLEIWQLSKVISIEIHKMTITLLPKYEMFEEGAQKRRSIKSIRSNIVEGYGRKRYKADFIKFLVYSYASQLEAKSQAEFLFLATKNMKWDKITQELDLLGIKIHNFILYVERSWKT